MQHVHDREVRPFIFTNRAIFRFERETFYNLCFVFFFFLFVEYLSNTIALSISNIFQFRWYSSVRCRILFRFGWNKNVPEQRGTFSGSIAICRISKGVSLLEEATNRTTSCLDLSNFPTVMSR